MGGPHSSFTRLQAPAPSQASRAAPVLVGRDREIATLRAALDDALAGHGRLVLIAGEPGIGKSALAEALSAEAGARGAVVSWARAPQTAGAPPYWLWTQTVRSQSAPADPATADPATPGRTPASGTPELARLLPELAPLLESPPIAAAAVESEAARFRLCDEIASFLLRCAAERGHVVVLDDLHAADPASLDVLAHLASRLGEGALLVVGTHRASDEDLTPALHRTLAAVTRERDTVHIALCGLDAAAVRAQLTQVTGRTVAADLAERVHARTGGNPFFVGEVGRLLQHDAANGATGTGIAEAVPLRVRDVLTWRLSRLPADTRDLLDVAALIGTDVPIDVLAAACAQPAAAVLAALEPAFRAGVLQRSRTAAHVQFAHGLVVETIAAAMPLGRAAQLHEQIAMAIETTRATTLDDWLATLTLHWSAAVPSDATSQRTVAVARLAAEQAARRLAHNDALPLWRIALDAAERARVSAGERAELLLGLARALFRAGDVAGSLDACLAAARAAQSAGRPDLSAAAALVVEGTGEPRWAHTLIGLAQSALAKLGDDDRATQARLHAQIGQLLDLTDIPDAVQRAQDETARAVALAEQSGDRHALQAALQAQQKVLSGPEGVDQRLAIATRMMQIGAESGDPWPALWGRLWAVDALMQLGRLAEAEAQLDDLEPVVARLRWPVARWHLLRARAAILQARARFTEALQAADEALAALSGTGLERAIGTHTSFLESQSDLVGVLPGWEERRRYMLDWYAREPSYALRPLASLLRQSEIDAARGIYARLAPPDRWEPPHYMLAMHLSRRLQAAIALGLRDDAAPLLARFQPLAHWHVVPGAGLVVTDGSGFLVAGQAAAFLGDIDAAVAQLEQAVEDNERCGVVAHAIVARQELAEVLVRRARGADLDRARRLAAAVLRDAERHGMRPSAQRAGALLRALPRRRVKTAHLTPREGEVARLVAAGLTNRQLAGRLGIAERTAETHVEHILTKLDCASRAQIAAWVASASGREGDPHS